MNAVHIGKGMYRIVVRSKEKRERLSRIPGVHIDGNRAIFPEKLIGSIELILRPAIKRKSRKPIQTSLL